MEIDYLDELFDVVYRKFLNAIDHIEYVKQTLNHSTIFSAWMGVSSLIHEVSE